jgi:hypothetical protein
VKKNGKIAEPEVDEVDGDDGVQLIGRVAHTRDLRCYFAGAEVRGYSGFRAPAGEMFAVLVIDCVKMGPRGGGPETMTNVNAFLRAAGWTPPSGETRSRKQSKKRSKSR